MKVLDYSGLARLVSNIRAFIADRLQPIDDRAPYHVKGALLVRRNAFLADDTYNGNFSPTGDFTSSDTGYKKAFLDRMLRGLPSALIFDTAKAANESAFASPATQIPFYLKKGSYRGSSLIIAVYESAIGIYTDEYSTARLTFNIYPTNMSVTYELGTEPETIPTTTVGATWLPFTGILTSGSSDNKGSLSTTSNPSYPIYYDNTDKKFYYLASSGSIASTPTQKRQLYIHPSLAPYNGDNQAQAQSGVFYQSALGELYVAVDGVLKQITNAG